MGTAGFGAERANEGVSKRGAPFFQRKHSHEDFLFALNHQDIGLQSAFDRLGDFTVRKALCPFQNPDCLCRCNNAHEPGIVFSKPPLDKLCRPLRLSRVVLREVADQDIGIEPDH